MQQWDYLTVIVRDQGVAQHNGEEMKPASIPIWDYIGMLSEEGWELAAFSGDSNLDGGYVFKRPTQYARVRH